MIRIHSCVGYWMNGRTDEWIICCPFASFYLSWTNNRNDYTSYGVARSLFEHRTIVFNIRFEMTFMYYKFAADEYLILCFVFCVVLQFVWKTTLNYCHLLKTIWQISELKSCSNLSKFQQKNNNSLQCFLNYL